MPATVIQISNASVKFGAVADPIDPATLTEFQCQVTRAEITSTSNTTSTSVAATYCQPASEATVPVASSFALDLEYFQDWTLPVAQSLSAFMFKHDAEKQAFALYLDGSVDPEAVGVITCQAGAFAGTPGEPLVATGTLPIDGYPVITDSAGAPIRAATVMAAAAPSTSSSKSDKSAA